ncbi:hypothetical protein [Paucisalibacillus globulus]|uniref:hypothetical protein n=1 Tax=Paucisalibacillus globulus TaxID=351095 RepID=UPI000BB92379|nr:hypothetical protein [Paucisalibacillus globulus]
MNPNLHNTRIWKSYCEVKFRHRDFKRYTDFILTDRKIYFTDEAIEDISFENVVDVVVVDTLLILKGSFYQDNQVVHEIQLNIFKEWVREKTLSYLGYSKETHSKGKLVLTNEETYREFPVNIKKDNSTITIIESKLKKKLLVIQQHDHIFTSGNRMLLFNQKGFPIYLIFDDKPKLDLTDFNCHETSYFHSGLQLYGSMGPLRFKGEEIGVLVKGQELIIFTDYHELYSFDQSQLTARYQNSHNGQVIYQFMTSHGEETFVTALKSPDEIDRLFPVNKDRLNDQFILLDNEPFKLSFIESGIYFYQSEEVSFIINYGDLKYLEVVENHVNGYSLVCLHVNSVLEKFHIVVDDSLLEELISTSFRKKKEPLLKEATITGLYSSRNRQINDFLMYSLFGQLILLQEGIEEIHAKTTISREQKNKQILNFMYYALREQKRQLDIVSIHFPQMLVQEQGLLHNNKEEIYEQLQRQMVSLSNQMQRHFVDIESSLNTLSFAIIPRKTFKKQQEKVTKRNYIGAAGLGGLGLLTGGTALVVASVFFGVKNYFSNQDRKKADQLAEENNNQKIEFFMNKALDSFDHLMETMLPYYVTQYSKTYFSFTQKQSKYLLTLDEEKMIQGKHMLFNQLVHYYTVKQLPLEKGNLLNRETVIQKLLSSSDSKINRLLGTISD